MQSVLSNTRCMVFSTKTVSYDRPTILHYRCTHTTHYKYIYYTHNKQEYTRNRNRERERKRQRGRERGRVRRRRSRMRSECIHFSPWTEAFDRPALFIPPSQDRYVTFSGGHPQCLHQECLVHTHRLVQTQEWPLGRSKEGVCSPVFNKAFLIYICIHIPTLQGMI